MCCPRSSKYPTTKRERLDAHFKRGATSSTVSGSDQNQGGLTTVMLGSGNDEEAGNAGDAGNNAMRTNPA